MTVIASDRMMSPCLSCTCMAQKKQMTWPTQKTTTTRKPPHLSMIQPIG